MERSWIYETNADNSARFVLGTVGQNPLVCFGVNPSTAEPGALDQTVTKVAGFASRNGYDSWVMLNLYPQRSTDPNGMHLQPDPDLQAQNERQIDEFIGGRTLSLLAAWGGVITKRSYLPQMLANIVKIADRSSCEWNSIGDPIAAGHPRHPSRPGYATPLQRFDTGVYLRRLK
ncbi:DUF1643 domain-containing protein [Agromyces mangrovi Wang et al. 2018]|uniref:DUF1643 domain-containing protein n=1 Tax=Agromyces mangrovi TaxID=1858653 RepID=UPI0025732DD8|nr:DUF1643 domain-containing protein [Agromyces mangrovi]BDZ65455.1 hypothetical protein GCM10025877_23930 [Agromyces mangrovi]